MITKKKADRNLGEKEEKIGLSCQGRTIGPIFGNKVSESHRRRGGAKHVNFGFGLPCN